uniref:Uncharacterized protein n=1 Tax=Romanomermis culicivorax TaxID=13658 RepID=A0A915L6E3_ROMCU
MRIPTKDYFLSRQFDEKPFTSENPLFSGDRNLSNRALVVFNFGLTTTKMSRQPTKFLGWLVLDEPMGFVQIYPDMKISPGHITSQ